MAQHYQQPQPPGGPPQNPPASAGVGGSSFRPSGGEQGRGGFMDFVMFRTMITPGLITVIWVIGFVVITIVSILSIDSSDSIGVGILAALAVWVIGNVYLRVVLELMIVLFRIYGRLGDVERNTRSR
jgi:hypothetical protein